MNRKRILSMLLAALLMLSTFPAALAADNESPDASGTSVDGGELTPSSTQTPAGTTPEDGTQTNPDDLDDTDDEQDDDKEDAESAKEPPVQTPVTEDEPEETPVRKKAASREAEGLASLTWDDITLKWGSNNYTVNLGNLEDSITEAEQANVKGIVIQGDDTNELAPDEELDDFCNVIEVQLTQSSTVDNIQFTFAVPDALRGMDDLSVFYWRFRPGDNEHDTLEFFDLAAVENDSFSFNLSENDSPYVYMLRFVTGSGENLVQQSNTYSLMLRIQKYDYLTWDDVSCEPKSGILEDRLWFPSTDELFVVGNEYGYGNVFELILQRTDESTPVEGKFTVSAPDWLDDVTDLKAKVWDTVDDQTGTVKELTNRSVEFVVGENSYIKPTVQFGTVNEDDEFVPLTYAHPFCFLVTCLKEMTWDDVEITPVGGDLQVQYSDPAADQPLRKESDYSEGTRTNWVTLFVEPADAGTPPSANLTVTPPASLADVENLVVEYFTFTQGDNTGDTVSDIEYIPVDKMRAISIPVNDDQIYNFRFGVIDAENNTEFLPRTYPYRFGVDVRPVAKLTWDNITAIDPSGAEFAAENIERDPASGALYKPGEDNANRMTVSSDTLKVGDKVRFKITCPTDATGVIARHIAFVKGLQTNPDGEFTTIDLDEDGSFTIDVDVIGAADITQIIHSLAFTTEDFDLVTDYYHFDFIAKAAGTVVQAAVNTNDNVLSATVSDNDIANAIENSDESTIYVSANNFYDGPAVNTVNVTLGADDVNAVVENDVTLQIATPIGTVTLPTEAIEQAKGEEENASIILEVLSKDGEVVNYQNISVEAIQNIEVSLYRVVDGGEPELIPLRMTSGNAVTVNVLIMDGLTLNQPNYYLVYLPESGSAVLEREVKPTDIDSNSCLTFTTSHLSEFALLSYDEAQKLGLFRTSTSHRGSSSGRGTTASTTPVTLKTGSNGSVTFSPSKPSEGDKVTVTVKPNSGYELDEIKATADGKNVKLSEQDENVFTFTMPEDPVTINTTFKRIEDTPEPTETVSKAIFYDVASSDWYAGAVEFVSERGMMAGNSGRFTPNDNLTRSMMAQILYNLEGGSGSGSASFPDVQASDWFAGSVSWAASQRLMDGYGNGSFGPNDSITREQLASILYRYAGTKGYSVSASADLSSFADGASVSDWAAESVRWAVGAGLLTGKSGSRLDPTGTATRAEVAQILMNFYTQVAA